MLIMSAGIVGDKTMEWSLHGKHVGASSNGKTNIQYTTTSVQRHDQHFNKDPSNDQLL